ncbi:hypothetical protein SAMN04488548_136223 [Gordonia westfalica]|uniref:Uncharacterized protein n=1 Tax=Gordonia westfalica TaxID=158898 RepID=A0A1H2LEL8_9ACTN|nr:hypothetical protein SAMN04488548_136223 [Gordonia westfalica]
MSDHSDELARPDGGGPYIGCGEGSRRRSRREQTPLVKLVGHLRHGITPMRSGLYPVLVMTKSIEVRTLMYQARFLLRINPFS